jgi:parallel beta-helix repeat protein
MKRAAIALFFAATLILVAMVCGVQITLTSNSPSNPQPTPSHPQASPSVSPSSVEFELPTLTPQAISIYVPDNYSTIQQAINSASPGEAIFVRAGDYDASVTINKAVWLIGENGQARIDAHSLEPDILICHSDVNITGFNLTNTPTPATGSFLEQMQGIGLPKQLPAIQVKNSQNCNIYGNKITDSSYAVTLESSSEIGIFNNEIYNCGFQIANSNCNKVIANSFAGGGTGINLQSSTGNVLVNNTIRDMSVGIWLDSSSGNTLRGNKLTKNYSSFHVTGSNLAAYGNDVDTSNTIEGKPIYYCIGKTYQVVPSDGACVVLVNCSGMIVQNSVLSLGSGGLVLANTNNSILQGNTLAAQDPALLSKYSTPGNPLDILIYHSHNNQIRSNCATVRLESSDNNTVTQNTGVIRLTDSNYNRIVGNSIHKVDFVAIDWSGITLKYSAYNLISQNTITDNSAGVWLCDGANNNRVENNTINGNAQGGIVLTVWPDSHGPRPESNIIFNNTLTDNGNQGILDSATGTQIIGNRLVANGGNGLDMSNDINCTVIGNVIEGFCFGMYRGAVNCTIVANNITINSRYSQYGVWFLSDTPGTFFHNNFFVPIDFSHSPNVTMVWDNGSEGNWWYFYTGVDSNGDGIGDTPYVINENNTDLYPLMKPYDITKAIPQTFQPFVS